MSIKEGQWVHPLLSCHYRNLKENAALLHMVLDSDDLNYLLMWRQTCGFLTIGGPPHFCYFSATKETSILFNVDFRRESCNTLNLAFGVLGDYAHNIHSPKVAIKIEVDCFDDPDLIGPSRKVACKRIITLKHLKGFDYIIKGWAGMIDIRLEKLFNNKMPICGTLKITRIVSDPKDVLAEDCYLINPLSFYTRYAGESYV